MKKYRKPYRIKRKKSLLKNRFLRLGILIFLFVISLSYLLFFLETFQVQKIIVTGEKKVSKESLEFFIERRLEKALLLFKTKSIFLLSLKEIRGDILNNFPPIAQVEISRVFPDTLNVLVTERAGRACWCQEGQYFLLDSEGIIFEEILRSQPELLEIKNQSLNLDLALGERMIEEAKISQILEVESQLKKEIKIIPIQVLIISEERLNIKTSEGWKIYLNPKEDIEWQLTKLSTVLEEELSPKNRESLEYIDLRFGNFAPYKYKD